MGDELERRLRGWMDGYVAAWNSNEPAAIGEWAMQHPEGDPST
jgi:hypothetical protein